MAIANTISVPAQDVKVAAEVDVCVIGGSCTGVFAAIAAARLGASVAIVEAGGFFGGVATAGLVCIWHSLYDTVGEKQIIHGLTAEVMERLQPRHAVKTGDPENPGQYFLFNPEELKIELDEMIIEAGVRPFLHCRFTTPIMDGNRIIAALVEDKSGCRAIRASCFIDASGDGDLAARAGFSCRTLDDLQPPTTCPIIHGLNLVRRQCENFDLRSAIFDPGNPRALPPGFIWTAQMLGLPDSTMIAGTRVNNADCSDADELTRAEIEGRRQARVICDILREKLPQGKGITLERLPAHIGIRETRHVDCMHQLTEEEVLAGARFPDAVANGSYRVDVHHSDRPGLTFRYLDGREVEHVPGREPAWSRWRPEQDRDPVFYQIPLRTLVPRGSNNLLIAGRLVDADRGAYGAIRVMVNTNQTGQAAGVAAYLALQEGCPITELDAARVRALLAGQGAIVI